MKRDRIVTLTPAALEAELTRAELEQAARDYEEYVSGLRSGEDPGPDACRDCKRMEHPRACLTCPVVTGRRPEMARAS